MPSCHTFRIVWTSRKTKSTSIKRFENFVAYSWNSIYVEVYPFKIRMLQKVINGILEPFTKYYFPIKFVVNRKKIALTEIFSASFTTNLQVEAKLIISSYLEEIELLVMNRSSHWEMFCQNGLLKSLRPRPATLLIKRLQQRCFLVNFAKFLRTTFFYRTSPVAAS